MTKYLAELMHIHTWPHFTIYDMGQLSTGGAGGGADKSYDVRTVT